MNNSICIRNVGLTVHIIHIFLNVKANCYMLIDTYHLFFLCRMSLGAAFQRSRATQKFKCDDELQMQRVSINQAIGAGHGELQEEVMWGSVGLCGITWVRTSP